MKGDSYSQGSKREIKYDIYDNSKKQSDSGDWDTERFEIEAGNVQISKKFEQIQAGTNQDSNRNRERLNIIVSSDVESLSKNDSLPNEFISVRNMNEESSPIYLEAHSVGDGKADDILA